MKTLVKEFGDVIGQLLLPECSSDSVQPPLRGGRSIEVKITIIKRRNFRDFDNWWLKRG